MTRQTRTAVWSGTQEEASVYSCVSRNTIVEAHQRGHSREQAVSRSFPLGHQAGQLLSHLTWSQTQAWPQGWTETVGTREGAPETPLSQAQKCSPSLHACPPSGPRAALTEVRVVLSALIRACGTAGLVAGGWGGRFHHLRCLQEPADEE